MFFIRIYVILSQFAGYEDFIFLILIILATAAQAYAQYRKKEMMKKRGEELGDEDFTSGEEEEPYSPIFKKFREAMGDEFLDKEEVITENFPVVEKKEPVIREQQKIEVVKEAGRIKPERAFRKPEAIKIVKVAQAKKTGKRSYKKLIRNDFDLRRAVIYSEILNRKYF